MLNFIIAALSCPGIRELVVLTGLALSLIVGLLNYRQIRKVSNTPALKDHLKKRK